MEISKNQEKSIKKWFGNIKFEVQIITNYHLGVDKDVDESGIFLNIYSVKCKNFFDNTSIRAWFEIEGGRFITAFAETATI